jgi:hypothetical protein
LAVHLTRRWGKTESNPDTSDFLAALEELKVVDPEHPDCWLADENDWTISAFDSGLVILENPETGEGPWHIRGVPEDEIVRLWNLLATGRLDEIKRFPWLPGHS